MALRCQQSRLELWKLTVGCLRFSRYVAENKEPKATPVRSTIPTRGTEHARHVSIQSVGDHLQVARRELRCQSSLSCASLLARNFVHGFVVGNSG